MAAQKHLNKFVLIILAFTAVVLAAAAVAFSADKIVSFSSLSGLMRALAAGCIIGVLALPFIIWVLFKTASLEGVSGYTLEEIDISEKDLTQAVSNWVYANHHRQIEGDIRFLEDEDGAVSCRVTVRKES